MVHLEKTPRLLGGLQYQESHCKLKVFAHTRPDDADAIGGLEVDAFGAHTFVPRSRGQLKDCTVENLHPCNQWANTAAATFTFKASPGTYSIFPTNDMPGVGDQFALSVFSDDEMSWTEPYLEPLFGWYDCSNRPCNALTHTVLTFVR